MYRYKINNSNTIYVSWEYYDEVRKICKKLKIKSSVHTYVSRERDVIIPMSLGQQILSRRYGLGILVSKKSNGVMGIRFGERVIKYMYPNAFKLGTLKVV